LAKNIEGEAVVQIICLKNTKYKLENLGLISSSSNEGFKYFYHEFLPFILITITALLHFVAETLVLDISDQNKRLITVLYFSDFFYSIHQT
jgi:hypothetical protein